jgi:hypothetical protein
MAEGKSWGEGEVFIAAGGKNASDMSTKFEKSS